MILLLFHAPPPLPEYPALYVIPTTGGLYVPPNTSTLTVEGE